MTKGREKNDLRFPMVMVGGPKTETERKPQHFSRALVTDITLNVLLRARTPPSTTLKPPHIMKLYGKYTTP